MFVKESKMSMSGICQDMKKVPQEQQEEEQQ